MVDGGVEMEIRVNKRRHARIDPVDAKNGGRIASKAAAQISMERKEERRRLTAIDNSPSEIDKRFAAIRAKRRGAPRGAPTPLSLARKFLSDPVQRFWLVCNCCCAGMLVLISLLYLYFIFPLMRPLFNY